MAWTEERIERVKELHAERLSLRKKASKLGISLDAVRRRERILGLQPYGTGLEPWTDERIEILRMLWGQGLSPKYIASELSGTTQEAVLSKAYRLGFLRRTPSVDNRMRRKDCGLMLSRPKRVDLSSGNARPVKRIEPGTEYAFTDTDETRAAIAQLTGSMCRWPEGDPMDSGFHFCGKHKGFMVPYCDHHMERAYTKRERRQ